MAGARKPRSLLGSFDDAQTDEGRARRSAQRNEYFNLPKHERTNHELHIEIVRSWLKQATLQMLEVEVERRGYELIPIGKRGISKSQRRSRDQTVRLLREFLREKGTPKVDRTISAWMKVPYGTVREILKPRSRARRGAKKR